MVSLWAQHLQYIKQENKHFKKSRVVSFTSCTVFCKAKYQYPKNHQQRFSHGLKILHKRALIALKGPTVEMQ